MYDSKITVGVFFVNPFPYSCDNKRYHTLAYHNRQLNCKTQKAIIDAGLSCPNIDGTCGTGGCIFCDGGSGYFAVDGQLSVTEQLKIETERIRRKNPDAGIVAYFQVHTNTYGPIEILRKLYFEALKCDIIGISIGTRPDCLSDEVVMLLKEVNTYKPLTVELGLQTSDDRTAGRINRGYPYPVFLEGFAKLRKAGIRVCVHIINGLPGETQAEMLNTAKDIAALRPDAVKIHSLHVIRGTKLESLYAEGQYEPISFDTYVDTTIRQLELLPPETVIERITGDGDKSKLTALLWSRDKIRVLGTIDKEMAHRNTWQGRLFV